MTSKDAFETGKAKKLFFRVALLLSTFLFFTGCTATNKGEPNGQPAETPPVSIPPIPEGWVPGTEGWIPPLPRGLDYPRRLSEEEWNRVVEIARTDVKVAKQVEANNIEEMITYWVAYSGGPGFYSDPDYAIMSGKVKPEGVWYYPAIRFVYRSPTDRYGQLVGVDLASGKVVLSNPSGIIDGIPAKPRPPG